MPVKANFIIFFRLYLLSPEIRFPAVNSIPACLKPSQFDKPRRKISDSFILRKTSTTEASINLKSEPPPSLRLTSEIFDKILLMFNTKNEKIAKAISIKEQEIDKLKEYKTVLIDQVVMGKVKIN